MVLKLITDSYSTIDGSEERHVKAGSRLSLVCRVHDSSGPPSFVFWYRDDTVVNYSERKGIHIWTGDAVPKDIDKMSDDNDDDATTSGNSTAASASASASSTATTELIDKTDVYSRHSVTTASTATTVAKSKARRKHRIRPLVVSILEISTVMPDDAGTYTCAPSNARNHSVVVHVIQGTVACQRLNTKCI